MGAPLPVQHNQQQDSPDNSRTLIHESSSCHASGGIAEASSREEPLLVPSSYESTAPRVPSDQDSGKPRKKKSTRSRKEEGGYPCEDCKLRGDDRDFDTDGQLRKHWFQVHMPMSERPFPCRECERRFCYKNHLQRHVRRVHKPASAPAIPQTPYANEPATSVSGRHSHGVISYCL